jgi:photosystem II stability/assembly factor-like uncharacterized protein
MDLLIGTDTGLLVANRSGAPAPVTELSGRTVRALLRADGGLFAGADDGIYRSTDGGRSWRSSGAQGQSVWELVADPRDSRTIHAGTQPAALYRSRDGGDSWTAIESLRHAPGAERWCLPNSSAGARARALVIDPVDADRWWVGIEVGGVASSSDAGASWTCLAPGNDPDVHVLVGHPGRPGVLYATTGLGRFPNDPEPMGQRIAGLFGSEDGGKTWRYLWTGLEPRYTRPMCIDPRAPHALTVGCAPSAFSSHRDAGGARSMLYQSADGGTSWRSLGDAEHSPSAANILAVSVAPDGPGCVLVGTDTGELWLVTPEAKWTLLQRDLPMVWSVLALANGG